MMNLIKLASKSNFKSDIRIPKWMLGIFYRRTISFADGLSDTQTRVFWLQSGGLTIDLRLPIKQEQRNHPKGDYENLETLLEQANLDGWYAHTCWEKNQLSWKDGASYQLHDRWPEPAELRRIGNCMMEFAPSGAYVEDWRHLNQINTGPMIGLELESETDLNTGITLPRSGALIINGEYAGLVLGRTNMATEHYWLASGLTLSQALQKASFEQRSDLLDFQTLVAQRNSSSCYKTLHTLDLDAPDADEIQLEGFSLTKDKNILNQRIALQGRDIERRWRIDSLEPSFSYQATTEVSEKSARDWRKCESSALDRYTRVVHD
jgi:hypothetical protein